MNSENPGFWSEARIYQTLLTGSQGDRDAAIEALDRDFQHLDQSLLVRMLLHAITGEYGVSHDATRYGTENTRDWLLAALARFAESNEEAERESIIHTDMDCEPREWVRYWTLASLYRRYRGTIRLTEKLILAEKDALVRHLAHGILAAEKSDKASFAVLEQGLTQTGSDGLFNPSWHSLRALRIAYVPGLVPHLIKIVNEPRFSDSVYDAVIALARIPPGDDLASTAADALHRRLRDWRRYYMWNTMRVQAIKTLGCLKQKSSVDVLVDDLKDENPAVAREAAVSSEAILGPKGVANHILQESLQSGEHLSRFGTALRFVRQRPEVVAALKEAMVGDSPERSQAAEALLRELGGAEALRMLESYARSMQKHLERLKDEEQRVLQQFEHLTEDARSSFGTVKGMDLVVFWVGIALLVVTAAAALWHKGSLDTWAATASTGILAGTGVCSVILGAFVEGPRKRMRQAINHLMSINVVFLGYLRQLRQVDQSFSRQFIGSGDLTPDVIGHYQKMVQDAMAIANRQLLDASLEGPSPAEKKTS